MTAAYGLNGVECRLSIATNPTYKPSTGLAKSEAINLRIVLTIVGAFGIAKA